MAKTVKPAPKGEPTLNPSERITSAQTRLTEITSAIQEVERDIDASNLTLMEKGALERLTDHSKLDPIPASEQVENMLNLLDAVELQAKEAAKSAREAGKQAEHLRYAVRSLYREVLAAGDRERNRLLEVEAARQQNNGLRDWQPGSGGN